MNTDKDALIKAKGLIQDPANWTQDPDDLEIGESTLHCARTALMVVCGGVSESAEIADQLAGYLPEETCKSQCATKNRTCLMCYNDSPKTTHRDILALYDRAIEGAQ